MFIHSLLQFFHGVHSCDESISQKELFLSKTLLKEFSGSSWSSLSDADRAALAVESGAEAAARLANFKRQVEDLGVSVGDVDKRSNYVVPIRQRRQKVQEGDVRRVDWGVSVNCLSGLSQIGTWALYWCFFDIFG